MARVVRTRLVVATSALALLAPLLASCSDSAAAATLPLGSLGGSLGSGSQSSGGDSTNPTIRCEGLLGAELDADEIGLPTSGAFVKSAEMANRDAAGEGVEFCLVLGEVLPVDPQAPVINFQVNMPTEWNNKSVQLGGGGFNGQLVTGLGNIPSQGAQPVDSPEAPIDRGYVTFGSDGGTAMPGKPPAWFATIDEALQNYTGESVKKTRDAAIALVRSYYGQEPEYQYHAGGSKGGQESLVAAQRYASDYDGVISYYPAAQNPGLVLGWSHLLRMAYDRPGGYLNPAKQQLVFDSVMATCDDLDGIADGVIADVSGCDREFNVNSLLCPDGTDTGDECLSGIQVETMQAAAEPVQFDVRFEHGAQEIGPWPVLHGAHTSGVWLDMEGVRERTGYAGFVDNFVRSYYLDGQGEGPVSDFDYRQFEDKIERMSRLYDVDGSDMDQFVSGGGKLLLVQGTTDMLVPHTLSTALYTGLEQRYGDSLNSFARYYVQPGYGHGDGEFNLNWDALTALENWAENDQEPVNQIAYDYASDRSMPLCQFPAWPKFSGSGSPTSADSYDCVTE